MIESLYGLSPTGFTAPGKGTEVDSCFTVDTDLERVGFLAGLLLYEADVFKDGIGFKNFFSGLVFWTLRNL